LNLKTGELCNHSPKQLVTKRTLCDYRHDAQCPQWLAFLDDIFDQDKDLIEYLQQALGYTLTGSVEEHCFFVCQGRGRNGKGTLFDTVLKVMGDYADPTDFEVFLGADKTNVRVQEAVGKLKGLRLALASETGNNRRFSEALIKRVTGGDKLIGTKLRGDAYSFWPTHKLWFLCNHMPAIKDATLAMWSRVRVIPFLKDYADNPDRELRSKLWLEREGILAWLVAGARKYLEAGKLPELPNVMEEAIQQYRVENDLLSRFISECMTKNPDSRIGVQDTYSEYANWCARNNEVPVPLRYFRGNMNERGVKSKEHKSKGHQFLYYQLGATAPKTEPEPEGEEVPVILDITRPVLSTMRTNEDI
jgi:putative DNA primase/helicase